MNLRIDITEMKSRELIKLLQTYPYGSLEIKYERVFWVSDNADPEPRQSPGDAPSRGYPTKRPDDWNKRFNRMQDALGRAIGI